MSVKKTIVEILGVTDRKHAESLITSSLFQDKPPKNGEVELIISMCESYGLNPLLGMLYIKRDIAGNIYPTLTVDGWYKLVNDQPDCNGYEFIESEGVLELPKQSPTSDASYCFESIGCKIYRKGRENTPIVYEYIQECFNPFNSAWFTHSKRLLRHKAFSQAARIVYNFSGIYDLDEVERIIAEKNGQFDGTTNNDLGVPDFEVVTPGGKDETPPEKEIMVSTTENEISTSKPKLEEAIAPAKVTKSESEEEKVEAIVETKDLQKIVEPDGESAKIVKQYLQNALKVNQVKECVAHLKGRMANEYHAYIESYALSLQVEG